MGRIKYKEYKTLFCIQCGLLIEKRQNESVAVYYKRKFCSRDCQHAWNTENKSSTVCCSYCGAELRKRNSHIRNTNFCSSVCMGKYYSNLGNKTISCAWCGREFEKTLSGIKKTKKNFCSRECFGNWQSKFMIGELSYGWKGGKTTLHHQIRSSKKNSDWVLSVFKRDKFTCQSCGDATGGNLNAHHKIEFKNIINSYNILSMADALECAMLWDVSNGITLCEICHRDVHRRKQ